MDDATTTLTKSQAARRERVLRAKTLLDGLHAEQRPRRHR